MSLSRLLVSHITVFFVCLVFLYSVSADTTENNLLNLSLSEAVQLALTQSIELQNDLLDLEISRSSNRITRSTYRPTLDLSTDSTYSDPHGGDDSLDHQVSARVNQHFASTGTSLTLQSTLNKYDDDDHNFDTSSVTTSLPSAESGQYANTMGLTLTQPLLRDLGPWADLNTVRKADLTLENAVYNHQLTQRNLVLRVISSYFTSLKQQKLVEVAEKSVEDANRHLSNTQIKMEEGLVALMDVSQAELQLARQQTSLIRSRQSVATSMDGLKLILNLPLSTSLVLTEEVENLWEPLDDPALIQEALDNRLEIKTLANQIQSAEYSLSQSQNQRLPALDLVLNAEVTHRDDDVSNVFKLEDEDYNVSMGFSWTFGDESNRENWLQSKIRLQKLQNEMIRERQSIEKEVLDQIRNYRALVEALKVSDKSVKIAEKALELATTSYREGLTSNLDLIKAQDDLTDARNGYYTELMNLAVAKATILNTIGREIDPDDLVINHEQ